MTWVRNLVGFCVFLMALTMSCPAAAQGSATIAPDRQILVMVQHPPDHYRPNGSYGGGDYGDGVLRGARERLARGIARQHGLAFVDGWPMPMIGVDCFIMAVPDGRSTAAAAEELAHDSQVAWAEPVQLYAAKGAKASHNDPLYPAQPAAKAWDLADLHREATGRGIRVAVIDSGIQANHPDLAGQLVVNRNFVAGQAEVAEDHGTGVAGVIAAKSDNGIGIAGVAPGARLLGLRACWQQRSGTVCDGLSLAKAFYFAVQARADVINLSLSGPPDLLIGKLVDVALARRIAVVAAFDKSLPSGGFPAARRGVIPVADETAQTIPAGVYGAPGRDLPTTQAGGGWCLVTGSSFAAAEVSGLAALAIERGKRPVAANLVRTSNGRIEPCATILGSASRCGQIN